MLDSAWRCFFAAMLLAPGGFAAAALSWGAPQNGLRIGIAVSGRTPDRSLRVVLQNTGPLAQDVLAGYQTGRGTATSFRFFAVLRDGKQREGFELNGLGAIAGLVLPFTIRLAPGETHEFQYPLKKIIVVDQPGDTTFESLVTERLPIRVSLEVDAKAAAWAHLAFPWIGSVSAVLESAVPVFEPGRVLPSGGKSPAPLAPGLLTSIYGDNLGPKAACVGRADTQHLEMPSPLRPKQFVAEVLIYPKVLCDTQVLVGGVPAGLLYVQERQINFKVPQETPVSGTVEIQVIHQGQSSRPVSLPLGFDSVTLSLESPARVGLPVWLKVYAPGWDAAVRYPFDIHPAFFRCHEVEVRRDGKLLPRMATLASQAFEGIAFNGNPCSSLGLPAESHQTGRLPLHLQYRLDQAGTYEVRYTARNGFSPDVPLTVQSRWTPIEILPGTQVDRTHWLRRISADAPPDATGLLTDFLPAILGIPDQPSLELLCPYLYHPDSLVREYAMYGLTYWPAEQAESAVWEAVQRRGPSDMSVQFLIRRPELAARYGNSIIQIAIRYLRSDSPVLLRGAVIAMYRAGLTEKSSVDPALRARAEAATMDAEDHVARIGDVQTVTDYACALGVVKDDRASSVLWDMVEHRVAREQAIIALTWRHRPADLPKLAQLALVPARGNEQSRELSSLPYALRQGYGDAAIPYLETLLAESQFTGVRTASASELRQARASEFDHITGKITAVGASEFEVDENYDADPHSGYRRSRRVIEYSAATAFEQSAAEDLRTGRDVDVIGRKLDTTRVQATRITVYEGKRPVHMQDWKL